MPGMDIVRKTQKRVEKEKKKIVKTLALKSYRKLAINFLILAVNLIIIILYFSLSEAKVVITPARERLVHSVTLPIIDANASTTAEELSIPGSIVSSKLELTQQFTTDASVEEPAQATGIVTVHNTTGRAQILVPTTRLQNDAGVLLRTKDHITVAPGTDVKVTAYADMTGKDGEVTAENGRFQIIALPYLKDKIYAEVTEAFTGGVIPKPKLTQERLTGATEAIKKVLEEKAQETLVKEHGAIPDGSAVSVEIEKTRASAAANDTGVKNFTVTASGTASAMIYDSEAAKAIIKEELIKKIPADKILTKFDDGSLAFTSRPATGGVEVSIAAEIAPKISKYALDKKDIIGKNRQEVKEHFAKITGIRDVNVSFSPFWVRSVPNLEDHVVIEVKN